MSWTPAQFTLAQAGAGMQSRFYLEEIKGYFPAGLSDYEKFPYRLRAGFQRHDPGVVSKCTFCISRIDRGLDRNLQPGLDPEATPVCVVNCPAQARYFGDLADPASQVSQLIATRAGYQLQTHLGTNPSVYYLR